MSALTCPGCGDLCNPAEGWCPECGKWLRKIGPTASELYARRKALLQAAHQREDSSTNREAEV